MPAAADVNLEITAGATEGWSFVCRTPIADPEEDGPTTELADLTGCTAEFKIRKVVTSERALLSLDLEDGITIDTETAAVVVRIAAEKSALLSAGTSVYGLNLTMSDGQVVPLVKGTLTILPNLLR